MRGLRLDPAEARRVGRGLARSPGFTIVAVLSLGLGIGATSAIYGAMHALLFLPLPVENPEELSLVYHSWPERWERGQFMSSSTTDRTDGREVASNVSWPAFERLREQAEGTTEFAAYTFARQIAVARSGAPAIAARGMLVSGEYSNVLRLGAAAGRLLGPSDDQLGAEPVVVLSHSFWQRAFGGDPSVVGSTIQLNGTVFTVVGVSQRGYVGLSPGGFSTPTDVMVPITAAASMLPMRLREGETLWTAGQDHWLRLIARVPSGTAWSDVAQEWTGILREQMVEAGAIAEGDAEEVTVRFLEGRRGSDSLRTDTRGPLGILAVVVLLVLLIACANLATLLLARGAARAEEMAVRRAIGASRWDLARPQLVESLLLGVLGGALGFLVALEGGPLLVASLTGGSGSAALQYQVSWPLVGVTTVAALVAVAVSGWMPAARMMGTEPGDHLGARGESGSGGSFRLGRALIAVQIAIAVPLVVAAGLFLQTLGNLVSIDPGFDPDGLAFFRVDAALVSGDRAEQRRIYEEIHRGLRDLPGVGQAAIVENVLVSGWQSSTDIEVDGETLRLDWNSVSSEFFATMGVPLLSGRGLSTADAADAPNVALVNETAERVVFGGHALGRRFRLNSREIEVVGVVADTKYSALRDEVAPAFFDPWLQRPGGLFTINYVIRSETSGAQLERSVRDLVSEIAPGLPVSVFGSQGDEIADQAARERVFARLLTVFGGFGLLLSCIGLHGLTAFTVSRRTREMGVRLALGAAPLSIVSLVLRQVLRLTASGLLLGLVAASQAGPLIESMLYGVDADSASTMAVASVVMVAVALIAGGVPALRASRVDPLESLSP
jgi:predicted permease